MSIVLLSATVGVGVRVWLSFGKGLLNALGPSSLSLLNASRAALLASGLCP